MFVVWLNYLRHVRVSPKNYVPLFGTYSHMLFHVLVVGFNYLRHVRFSPGPLYPCLVHVPTCHFMCCVVCIMLSCTSLDFICTTSTRFTASALLNLILRLQILKQSKRITTLMTGPITFPIHDNKLNNAEYVVVRPY
jgi:hypothetical protein